jgi:hypothetical protein
LIFIHRKGVLFELFARELTPTPEPSTFYLFAAFPDEHYPTQQHNHIMSDVNTKSEEDSRLDIHEEGYENEVRKNATGRCDWPY